MKTYEINVEGLTLEGFMKLMKLFENMGFNITSFCFVERESKTNFIQFETYKEIELTLKEVEK
ncbi:MAG: hypothetical protein KAU62_04060 [Candidatus Heimdallarchaeota archaeon]|nr:hypothetical protein [Candidatus Heimdallarchaeota archaeon]MCK4610311.1 hypothetical protein [Candidatus Heimdallarchaeota archaeon]